MKIGPEMMLPFMICECQDSNGDICGKPMSREEFEQDGMCSDCADNVYEEMMNEDDEGNTTHFWTHTR